MKELRIIILKAWNHIWEYFFPLLLVAIIIETIILIGNWILFLLINPIHFKHYFINVEYIKGILSLSLSIVMFPITLSAVTHLITTDDSKLSTAIYSLLFIKTKFSLLILWGCLWFLFIFLGLELFAFPGIFALIAMIFVGPIITNEKLNIHMAVKRSFKLIRKRFLNVFIILLVFIFVQAILAHQGANYLTSVIPTINVSILRWLLSIVFWPLVYVPIAEMFLFRQNETPLLKNKLKVKKTSKI